MNDSLCPRQNDRSGALGKAVITLMILCGFLLSSGSAFAAASGCDPKILAAQTALALARVAADKALDDEVNSDMPSSVLDLTCFDQAAAFSAKNAGAIFSGDFSNNDGFKSVMNDALKSMESNFVDSTIAKKGLYVIQNVEDIAGGKATAAGIPGAAKVTDFNCDVMSKLWGSVNNAGVKMNVPYPTFNDLLGGAGTQPGGSNKAAPPGVGGTDPTHTAGTNYQASWGADSSQTAFKNLATANAALPARTVPSFKTNGSGAVNTPCQVMQQAMSSITCP